MDALAQSRRVMRLRGVLGSGDSISQRGSLDELLEGVIQPTIRDTLDTRMRSASLRLPSTIFLTRMREQIENSMSEERRVHPELLLLSHPIAFFEFRLKGREYVSVEHLYASKKGETGSPRTENFDSFIYNFQRTFATTRYRPLREEPTASELISVLCDHLMDVYLKPKAADGASSSQASRQIHGVHPARRAAISNWIGRWEDINHHQYFEDGARTFYSPYPIVNGLLLDQSLLAIFIVSPLDPNFLDEKIPEDHRISEITLGFYDVENSFIPGGFERLVPVIKGAFARVLFTCYTTQNSHALANVFGEMSAVMGHWFLTASDGIRGLLEKSLWKAPFDAFAVCKAIVSRVLCADIPGVSDLEIYPFDRVFIFRQAATTDQVDDEPIEVLMMEASILSNNPADRGAYLTRRERELRETHDYECDPSKKRILSKNVFHLYIHGYKQGLILSTSKNLTPDQKRQCFEMYRSQSQSETGRSAYFIAKPERRSFHPLDKAVYNLLCYLLPDTREEKADGTIDFREDFERLRLEIREKFDEHGLFFRYDHGLNLSSEVPWLYQLLETYFDFMDDRFLDEDERYLRSVYQKRFKDEALEAFLKERRRQREQRRGERLKKGDGGGANRGRTRESSTKVTYVSFCSTMHDQNISLSHSSSRGRQGEDTPLMGPEYAYTMILIADKDREKSQARVTAERENLHLFFKLLMRQIWMDKLVESQYLDRKSQSIAAGLSQFLHRAKGIMKETRQKEELDSLYEGLKPLVTPVRAQTTFLEIGTGEAFWREILELPPVEMDDSTFWSKKMRQVLEDRICAWLPSTVAEQIRSSLVIHDTEIPDLRIYWAPTVVRDAFVNLLKNACEAAGRTNDTPRVTLQLAAYARGYIDDASPWYLDITIENTGGPIPERILRKLNAANPTPLERDQNKKGSTGIGVYLSRIQLQDVIGEGADIFICNVGKDRVQSHLRLPAWLLRVEKQRDEQRAIDLPNSDYLLYIEDDSSHYVPMSALLESVLEHHPIELRHARGSDLALKLCEHRLPVLIISDLMIPREEDGAPGALLKNGIDCIQRILSIAKNHHEFPPIWIVSAETAEEISGHFPMLSDHGYEMHQAEVKNISDVVCQPGRFCVFPVKNLVEVEDFDLLLEIVFKNKAQADASSFYSESKTPAQQIETNVRTVSMKEKKWDQELARTYERAADTPAAITFVICEPRNKEAIGTVLLRWFTHPGLPDPDAGTEQPSILYPLYNHVFHKRLVLLLQCREALRRSVSVKFLYWGLSHNIWFDTLSTSPDEVARRWMMIRNEARGPLSVLRHDVKNKVFGEQVIGLRDSIIEATHQCEQWLTFSKAEEDNLQGILQNESSDSLLPQAMLVKDQRQYRAEVSGQLGQIQNLIFECAHRDPSLRTFLEDKTQMLNILEEYLGGEK